MRRMPPRRVHEARRGMAHALLSEVLRRAADQGRVDDDCPELALAALGRDAGDEYRRAVTILVGVHPSSCLAPLCHALAGALTHRPSFAGGARGTLLTRTAATLKALGEEHVAAGTLAIELVARCPWPEELTAGARAASRDLGLDPDDVALQVAAELVECPCAVLISLVVPARAPGPRSPGARRRLDLERRYEWSGKRPEDGWAWDVVSE